MKRSDTLSDPRLRSLRAGLAALTVAALLIVFAARDSLQSPKFGTDFLCYWTAGRLLASGQNPYDAALQAEIQRQYGWDKAEQGLGIYDFVPYFYPPWFGLLFVPLVPLGFATAKLVWTFLNLELLFLSGYFLAGLLPRLAGWVSLAFVCLFLFSVISLLAAQTAILTLFLMVLGWKCLEEGRDRTAGVILAWLTIKPQLAGVLLLGLFLWAVRERRWRVLQGFGFTLAALAAVSSLLLPAWLPEMLRAIRATPPPTSYYPWIGATWLLLLRTLSLDGWPLTMSYLVLAVPFLGAVIAAALGRRTALRDIVGTAVLGAFFIAPYARHYDFPILLVPALLLIGERLGPRASAVLLAGLTALPYAHLLYLLHLKETHGPILKLHGEWSFFWIPALLSAAWFATRNCPRVGQVCNLPRNQDGRLQTCPTSWKSD